jgi:hypothetical protein
LYSYVDHGYSTLQKETSSISQFANFNTTAHAQAAHDQSTIDYAFFPIDYTPEVVPDWIKVPYVPDNYSPVRPVIASEDAGEHFEGISLASADSTHINSPAILADSSELLQHDIDPYQKTIADAAKKEADGISKEADEDLGVFKTLWNGLVEDIMGPAKKGEPVKSGSNVLLGLGGVLFFLGATKE